MFLSYITTESDGALTLDQLLRGPLSLSAREAREAKRRRGQNDPRPAGGIR